MLAIVSENFRIPQRIGFTVLEGFEHVLPRGPVVAPARDGMLLVCGPSVGKIIPFWCHDHRVNEDKSFEGLGLGGCNLYKGVAAHRVANADSALQIQMANKFDDILCGQGPVADRAALFAAAVALDIDSDDMEILWQVSDGLIPHTRVEASGVHQQYSWCAPIAPLDIRDARRDGVE